MANYLIDDQKMAGTAATTMNEYDIAKAQLAKIKADLDALTADGYNTPSAQTDFKPFVEEFTGTYTQVMEGLTGISNYVKKYGEAMVQMDSDMGSSLRAS
ncbi:WXG100 family type VII secretion target [Streptomyces sp. NPDC047072]|uniref:WXG100 family type VII secretion target n=1 Tax=Streptomyces sp. NPDC047072 TaxID=3154809 RepID=UPI0033FC96FE